MTHSADPPQWDCSEARIALGVYVLGVIDPAEQALVEAHLDGCDACQAEMAELADLLPLLALVPAEEATKEPGAATRADGAEDPAEAAGIEAVGTTEARAPQRAPASEDKRGSGEPVGPRSEAKGLPRGVARRADGHPRKRGVRGVGVYPPGVKILAAAVVIAAASFGGVKLASSLAGQDQHDAVGPTGAWQTGHGSTGGITATVAFRPAGWGTQLAAMIAGLPVHTQCQLWVIEGNGTRVQAGGWDTDAAEGTVWYPGSAQVPPAAIKSFVITVAGGQPVTVTPG
jgi:hypothetical protein